MKDTYFVVGISTEVGKTVVSAILTEALQADYWKPIQSGDLENSDTHKVKRLISNSRTVFHPNSYGLHTPASPHLSAQLDGVRIELSKIVRPTTDNTLIIEAAGGLYVPLNDEDTMLSSDYLIDIGPGAGSRGGYVVAAGTPTEVMQNPNSLTGQYLSGKKKIAVPKNNDNITFFFQNCKAPTISKVKISGKP